MKKIGAFISLMLHNEKSEIDATLCLQEIHKEGV